jgi:hypothetical protein
MPYITLAEQGYKQPGDQIQEAAQAQIQQNMIRQEMAQRAQAFPVQQRLAAAQASQAETESAATQKNIQLQQQAQDLKNRMAQTQLAFEQETNPQRKALLGQQLDNLKNEGQLLLSQAGEAQARGGYFAAETYKDNPAAAPYNTVVKPGTLDPYGNQITTTSEIDKTTGQPVGSQQTYERGRGIPRAAYVEHVDPATGQITRQPGIPQVDPDTGIMTIRVAPQGGQSDQDAADQKAANDAAQQKLVDEYFNSQTGQPKSSFLGMGTKGPESASDRAALSALLQDPAAVNKYGLNAYGPLAAKLGIPATPAPTTPLQTSPAAPGTGASAAIKPSSVTSSSGDVKDVSRTGDSGPSGALPVKAPALTAPQDTPTAGVGPLGTPPKAGENALASPSVGNPNPVPIRSGRSGTSQPAGGTPAVSGKKASKFSDLPVDSYFMQNGVRYHKTGPTSAEPAEAVQPSAGQIPSLPAAMGT